MKETLHDALAYALEFEAVKEGSRRYARVRQVRTCAPEYRNMFDNSDLSTQSARQS